MQYKNAFVIVQTIKALKPEIAKVIEAMASRYNDFEAVAQVRSIGQELEEVLDQRLEMIDPLPLEQQIEILKTALEQVEKISAHVLKHADEAEGFDSKRIWTLAENALMKADPRRLLRPYDPSEDDS